MISAVDKLYNLSLGFFGFWVALFSVLEDYNYGIIIFIYSSVSLVRSNNFCG